MLFRSIDFSAPSRAGIDTFIRVDVVLSGAPHSDVLKRAALDLSAYAPPEDVVYFRMYNTFGTGVDTYARFPNLRALSFDGISLSTAFPNPNQTGEGKISPSLEHILLEHMVVDDASWSPLVTFLAHRVSSGNRLDTLVIISSPHMCTDVTESIRGMVRELRITYQRRKPPQGICCT